MLLMRRQLERQNWQPVKIGKTTTLHVHHALFARLRHELTNFTFYRQREHMKDEFLFLFSNLDIFVQNSTKGQSKRVWIIA